MPLVTKDGFSKTPDTVFVALDEALDLPNDADLEAIAPKVKNAQIIRIPFPSFADGRGFSVARRLRDLGYSGHLRAHGHIINEQFRYALECGFDDLEISDEQAARQPEAHWSAEPALNYREKLARREGARD